MRSYEVRHAHLMPAEAAAYQPFFFHTRDFVLRNGPSQETYTLLVYLDGEAMVRMHFSLHGSEAISLPRSSFGGFDIHPDCSEEDLIYALQALREFCAGKHIHRYRITMYPACYDTFSGELIHRVLIKCGVRVTCTDITQYLVTGREAFDAFIDRDERRHLNHARKHGWRFWQETPEMLTDAYQLIVQSREQKGYPVTMELDALHQAFSQFPDRYQLFSLRNEEGSMLSVSICIHVNEQILYDFYHGDDIAFRKHSPVVPLIEGLFSYSKSHGYSLLDLGTSTERGVKNENLFRFKKHLGAVTAPKQTYEGTI